MTALKLPVLAVVAAIGLAVAAGILIYKNWDKIKAKAVELGAKISEVWGNIKTGVSEAVANLVSAFQSNFPLLSAYLSGWWESVSAAWENVKAIFANIIDFVQNVFAGNWSAAWDNIVAIFGNVFGMIVNLAKAPINGVISAINWVLEKINSISVTIPDWVPASAGKPWALTFRRSPPWLPVVLPRRPRWRRSVRAESRRRCCRCPSWRPSWTNGRSRSRHRAAERAAAVKPSFSPRYSISTAGREPRGGRGGRADQFRGVQETV